MAADPAAKRPRLSSETSVAWAAPATTFTWKLEDVSVAGFAATKAEDRWMSDAFDACGLRWQLSCKPQAVQVEGVPGCRFFLKLLSEGPVIQLSDDSEFRVAGSLTRPLNFSLGRTYSLVQGPGRDSGIRVFIEHADFNNQHNPQLPGTVTLTAFLRARSFAQVVPVVPRPPMLSAGLAAALSSGDLADVKFKAPDGSIFSAHAFILGLSSSTLRALLVGPMAQQKPCIGSPPLHAVPGELESGTFKAVLHFLYTEGLPAGTEDDLARMRALLSAADYLDLPRLHEVCVARLHAAMAPDNAVETLKVATKVACASLRDATLRYTAAHAQAVLSSADWSSLSPEIAADVMHTMAVGEPPFMAARPT